MAKEGPLSRAEEWVSFHIGRAGAGTDAADFIFYEKLADERLAEARRMGSTIDLEFMQKRRIRGHTVIFAEHQNALGMARHRGEC